VLKSFTTSNCLQAIEFGGHLPTDRDTSSPPGDCTWFYYMQVVLRIALPGLDPWGRPNAGLLGGVQAEEIRGDTVWG